MNNPRISSWIVALVLAAVTSAVATTPDVHAMGKKRQQELDAEKQRNEELQRQLEEARRKLEESQQETEQEKLAREKAELEAAKKAERDRIREEEEKKRRDRLGDEVSRVLSKDFDWVPSRCTAYGDSLPNDLNLTLGRFDWSIKCLEQRRDQLKSKESWDALDDTYDAYLGVLLLHLNKTRKMVGTRQTPLYPAWGKFVENGDSMEPVGGFVAPTSSQASCDPVLEGGEFADFTIVAICESSCFTPDQRILLEDGYLPIEEARSGDRRSIMAVSQESSLDRVILAPSEVDYYIRSLVEGQHEIIEFETLSEKRIKVTTQHPMVKADGTLVSADALKIGDQLVSENGEPETIVRMTGYSYYGRVYNVRMASSNPVENVIVAEGLLTGSSFFQNEGMNHLNRQLFRINLPESLIK